MKHRLMADDRHTKTLLYRSRRLVADVRSLVASDPSSCLAANPDRRRPDLLFERHLTIPSPRQFPRDVVMTAEWRDGRLSMNVREHAWKALKADITVTGTTHDGTASGRPRSAEAFLSSLDELARDLNAKARDEAHDERRSRFAAICGALLVAAGASGKAWAMPPNARGEFSIGVLHGSDRRVWRHPRRSRSEGGFSRAAAAAILSQSPPASSLDFGYYPPRSGALRGLVFVEDPEAAPIALPDAVETMRMLASLPAGCRLLPKRR